MNSLGSFPFGQPVREVEQTDRTQKHVFVLGVYASAVHARWVGSNNKTIVNALAVASEPTIFWRGENAEAIIQNIFVPPALGRLVPANQQFNGPSGVALDELILTPLGLTRSDAWLCDLVPHSCLNPAQSKAIERAYLPEVREHGLPKPTVPPVPTILAGEKRRSDILEELLESEADTLILLGDQPIRWFLSYFDPRWQRLADFLQDGQPYGTPCKVQLNHKHMEVIALAHPRQIARLGHSSPIWYNHHQTWINRLAARMSH